jgi:hypothetical protein
MSHDLGMKTRVHPKYKTKYRDINPDAISHDKISMTTSSSSLMQALGPRQPFELRCSCGVR